MIAGLAALPEFSTSAQTAKPATSDFLQHFIRRTARSYDTSPVRFDAATNCINPYSTFVPLLDIGELLASTNQDSWRRNEFCCAPVIRAALNNPRRMNSEGKSSLILPAFKAQLVSVVCVCFVCALTANNANAAAAERFDVNGTAGGSGVTAGGSYTWE